MPDLALSLGRVAALRVIHPLPCALNAVVVGALSLAAGASTVVALVLAGGMFSFQATIGAVNDIADRARDAAAKPDKPIPAGLVSPGTASVVALGTALLGLLVSATFGLPVLLLGAVGLACGLAYDVALRQRGLGWLCYALAFPVLLAWTWRAAAGTLPPGWPVLLPLAALAGPTIHLANSLVDVGSDMRVGTVTLATRLGRRDGLLTLVALSALVWLLAWAAFLSRPSVPRDILLVGIGATLVGALGVLLSWRRSPAARELGWLLQVIAFAVVAVVWVVTA
jgi:4-hydroxybenzoate polyprenyltransferase